MRYLSAAHASAMQKIEAHAAPPFKEAAWITSLLAAQNGTSELLKLLNDAYPPQGLTKSEDLISPGCHVWTSFGVVFREHGRIYESLDIFYALYEQLLESQMTQKKRVHKGLPLYHVSHCYRILGFNVYAKRYMMLALCEDAITGKGTMDFDSTNTFGYLTTAYGHSGKELHEYASEAFKLFDRDNDAGQMPEWILQQLDQRWQTEVPSAQEAGVYRISQVYCRFLIGRLGSGDGKTLELLAEYLVGAMPGCRTYRRAVTRSTDYDIVVSVEGQMVDFRSELGRYFVCEAKDWTVDKVSFAEIAKFCRVLDSVKAKFGIVFTRKGHSGEGKATNADREILKVYHDRGIVIVVVTDDDLQRVSEGTNFISLLREKYEVVRLDLLNQ
jgi:hypothetical protein